MNRRLFMLTSSAALANGCALAKPMPLQQSIAAVEQSIGGRLGVAALDTHSGRTLSYNETARFAMASTFKLLLAAAALSEVDRGRLALDKRVPISKSDLVSNSPFTAAFVESGTITVEELCSAVTRVSDNTAANLLLLQIGGPAGYTRFARGLGDNVTQLDRTELDLNMNLPGDVRDTTSPSAMIHSMRRVLIDDALSIQSREQLITWLIAVETGRDRIRAGLPKEWRVGDKTGTGYNSAVNDLAIFWPPGRQPVLLAIYTSESSKTLPELNFAHAEITRMIVRHWIGS
jgi:beta-lactamase class A